MINPNRDIVSSKILVEDFDELIKDLVKEIEIRNYSVTRINNIDNIHKRLPGESSSRVNFRRYKIVEFCNLGSCGQLISSHLMVGLFMPARFVVFQPNDEDLVTIAFLKPTAFAKIFDSKPMEIALRMEQDMKSVLEEITL